MPNRSRARTPKQPAKWEVSPSIRHNPGFGIAAKVMRSNILEVAFRTSGLHHAPDDLRTESSVANPLGLKTLLRWRNIGPVLTPAAITQLLTAALTRSAR